MSHPLDAPGRHELDWALAALERGARAIALVGMAGAGKTWLLDAIQARLTRPSQRVDAGQLDAAEPGGVVFCDAPAADSVLRLLERLGPEGQLVFTARRRPSGAALDGICELVEVTPLAFSTGPRGGEGGPASDVRAPASRHDDPAARLLGELILRRSPRLLPTGLDAVSLEIWGHLSTIATAVDGLPGALVLAAEGARLMGLATLAQRVRTEPELLFGPLLIALGAELDALSSPVRTALERLAVCASGVRVATAEALVVDLAAGASSRFGGALGLLAELRDWHLLVQRDDRLVVPRLVRVALAARTEPPRRDVALRLAALAEQTTQRAMREGRSEPLAWIGAERDDLLHALDCLGDAPAAWPLLDALLLEHWRGTAPSVRAHMTALLDGLDRLLDTLPAEPSVPLSPAVLSALFQASRNTFGLRDGPRLARVAAALERLASDSFAAAWAKAARAIVASEPEQRDLVLATIAHADRARDPLALGLAHLLASGAFATIEPDLARHHAEAARDRFEALGYDWGHATALANLGYFALFRGDLDAARQHARDAIAVAERSGDRKSLATSLGNLGLLELDQGNLVVARDLLVRSHDLHVAMGRIDFMVACWNGLARVAVEAVGPVLSPSAAREVDRAQRALGELESRLGEPDRRRQQLESALVRAEMALLSSDPETATQVIDAALAQPELAELPGEALVLHARRALLAPETAAPHRAAVAALASSTTDAARRAAALAYAAVWCPEASWPERAAELGRLLRVRLAGTPPLGLQPAWNNSALVRAALRTSWRLLPESRRQDVEAEARDPEHVHLVAAPSTGRFRMPRQAMSDVSRRPLLVHLLGLLVAAALREELLDEATLGLALWPGERMRDDARANRIQNAVSLLRKAGLKDHLERVGDRYRIDPHLPIIVVTGAREALDVLDARPVAPTSASAEDRG
ncbi:MAG: tetratricopeptide repeat protein [Deltaproteobacteria bacterium]|nr:tetratricopeptide repeat protein [Deltaproteobacteria bacterium]